MEDIFAPQILVDDLTELHQVYSDFFTHEVARQHGPVPAHEHAVEHRFQPKAATGHHSLHVAEGG